MNEPLFPYEPDQPGGGKTTMEPVTQNLEVLQPTALEAITKAEVDIQVSTAHKYPRAMSVFKRRAMDMALIDEETAASCLYCRPVGKKNGKPEFAEGLSIRMAEIVAASYGNIRVGSLIIEQSERLVKARGFAHDLESNFASTSEVIEPTVMKDGTPYSESMRAVVAKAALAKAWRDALFKVVPRALAKPIEAEVRRLATGDAKSLATRRQAVMAWVAKLGIDPARVFAAVGVAGEADIGADHLVTLTGLRTAIKDGELKIDDAFPEITTPEAPSAPKLAGRRGAKAETTAAPASAAPPPDPEPKPEPAAGPADQQAMPEPVPAPEPEPEPPAELPLLVQQLRHVVEVECKATFEMMVAGFRNLRWHPTLVPKLKSWADMPERTAAGILGERTKPALVNAISAIQKGIAPA